MSDISIGIDFGTTKTLVTYGSAKGYNPEIAYLGRGGRQVPTTAFLSKTGEWLFGDDADDYACDKNLAVRYGSNFKFALGSSSPVIQIIDRTAILEYTAQQVTARYLAYIRKKFEQELCADGQRVTKATITHPVDFTPAQLNDLRKAATEAGFSRVTLLQEPEAAGIAYCMLSSSSDFSGNALVVDWGGGSLDLSLISRKKNDVTIHKQYARGIDTIGGTRFDDYIWQDIAQQLKKKYGKDITLDSLDIQRMQKKRIRDAKEALSVKESVNLQLVGAQGAYPNIHFTRAELERIITPHVQEGIDLISSLLNSIKAASLRPSQVLLIGGSSKIPLISQLITKKTGLSCKLWEQSNYAVALGATLSLYRNHKFKCQVCDSLVPYSIEKATCPCCYSSYVVPKKEPMKYECSCLKCDICKSDISINYFSASQCYCCNSKIEWNSKKKRWQGIKAICSPKLEKSSPPPKDTPSYTPKPKPTPPPPRPKKEYNFKGCFVQLLILVLFALSAFVGLVLGFRAYYAQYHDDAAGIGIGLLAGIGIFVILSSKILTLDMIGYLKHKIEKAGKLKLAYIKTFEGLVKFKELLHKQISTKEANCGGCTFFVVILLIVWGSIIGFSLSDDIGVTTAISILAFSFVYMTFKYKKQIWIKLLEFIFTIIFWIFIFICLAAIFD